MKAGGIFERVDREQARFPDMYSALHLITVFTVAVAHPLYQVLGHADHGPFFVAHQSRGIDVLALILFVSVLLPGALCGLVWLVARASTRLARLLYLLLLSVLFAGAFLPITTVLSAPWNAVLAFAGALLTTACYVVTDWGRTALSFMSLAVLVSPAMLLLGPTVRPLLSRPDAMEIGLGSDSGRSPDIVMVVFDELPLISLLDQDRTIDPVRYPNFHRLAETANWYRNATTSHFATSGAIASLLVGGEYAKYLRRVRQTSPARSALLDRSNAPDNLFSLLENDYQVLAIETTSKLAAETVETDALVPPMPERLRGLVVDCAILYAHIVVPQELRGSLPVIEGQWSDFLGPRSATDEGVEWRYGGAGLHVKRFLDLLRDDQRPSFFYLHVLIPHFPFMYNERGQAHSNKFRFVTEHLRKATGSNNWPNEAAADLAYQAHLLQVGYTDLLLGLILDELAELGIFDDSVVVVTADHGTSFYWDPVGLPRQELTAVQASETLYVPLIVKLPGQRSAMVSDAPVQTIDILPTIAELAGAEISWPIDGVSLLAELAEPRSRFAYFPKRETLPNEIDPQHRALARKVELFGVRSRESVYQLGPHADLVGTPVSDLPSTDSTATVELVDADQYLEVDPDGSRLPAYVEGEITGLPVELHAPGVAIAVSVNGTIRSTAATMSTSLDSLRPVRTDGEPSPAGAPQDRVFFLARIPPDSLRRGVNEIAVYLIEDDTKDRSRSLTKLGSG